MKRVYVAGAFRAWPDPQNQWVQHQNIERANAVNLDVWQAGAAGFCPHKNTEHFEGALPGETFLRGDLVWLAVADAMVVVPGWEQSLGTIAEIRFARERGIPVFFSGERLREWLGEQS